jgi:hypothetical protein
VLQIDPQVISRIIGVPVFHISANPFNETLSRFPLWRILGSSFMLFQKARSELQISESMPFLPRTACSQRLSSTISGLLFVGVI